MKKLQKITMLFLVLVMWVVAAFSVSAATQVKDGLDITVQTDKQKYETNEKITAWITVKNTNNFGVDNISVECVIPAGYKAESDASLTIPTLASWAENTLTVVLVPKAGSVPATGDSSNILLWSFVAILAVVALSALCLKVSKKRSSVLAMLLCAAMVLASLPMGALEVKAAEATETVTVQETVEIGSEKLVIEGKVTYNAFVTEEEADNSGSEPGVDEPSVEEPGVDEPSGEEPGGDEPDGDEPGGEEPGGDEPGGDEPGGDEPGGDEPGGDEPGGDEPGGDEPGGEEPGGDEPGGDEPGGEEPGGDDTSDEPIMVYVSPNGDDANPGTLEQPVKTLEGARDLVRELKADRTSVPAVTVYLRGGNYVLSQTFALTTEDSGTAEAPVTYRAYPGEEVVITGSAPYSMGQFGAVTGEMKDKLPTQEAKDNVVVASLADLGISSFQMAPELALYKGAYCQIPLLMLDGHNLNLTRYSNSLYDIDWIQSTVTKLDSAGGTVTLNIAEDDPYWDLNVNTDDFIYHGRVAYGYEPVFFRATADASTHTVKSDHSVSYATSGLRPVQILNAYQSLDEPGEWYFDDDNGLLYIYPYADTTTESELYITEADFDLITVTDAEHINLEGMTVMSSKGVGIYMEEVENCVVNNCEILSFYGSCVSIQEAVCTGIKNSVAAYSHISAVRMEGGDYTTLERTDNYISNNVIHDGCMYYQRNIRGIYVRGIGDKVDHNDIYNFPDCAISYSNPNEGRTSVDLVIEYNTIHDSMHNSGDMGLIYGCGDLRCQNVIVRNNHFYNYGKFYKTQDHPSWAVYGDRATSGLRIYNNIVGPGASGQYTQAFMLTGTDNQVYNNLLIDVPNLAYVWMQQPDFETYIKDGSANGPDESLAQVWENPLWTARWPWMQAAREQQSNYYIKQELKNNVMVFTDTEPYACISSSDKNAWVYVNKPELLVGLDTNLVLKKDASADNRSMFVDYANGDYRLVDSILAQTEFENIDQTQIGIKTFTYEGAEYLPGGSAPVVSNIQFDATEYKTGDVVQVTFDLSTAATESKVEFYVADKADERFYLNWARVDDDNSKDSTLAVTTASEGKWLKCKVTPIDSTGIMGEAVWSEAVYVKKFIAEKQEKNINELLEDSQNWVVGGGKTTVPVLTPGSLSLTGSDTENYSVIYYKGATCQNTVFSFKYKQTGFSGGFYLKIDNPATEMPYTADGVLVWIAENQIELQLRGKSYAYDYATDPNKVENTYIESGKTHDVTFGMYDISATQVRIIMTVDGVEVFNVVSDDESFRSAEAYLGFFATKAQSKVEVGSINEINEQNINAMVSDGDNWVVGGGKTIEPVVAARSVSLTSTTGQYAVAYYKGDTFRNTVFSFKYTPTFTSGQAAGLFLKVDNPDTEMPYIKDGIMVYMSPAEIELQMRGNNYSYDYQTDPNRKANTYFVSGQEYDVTFGMYDVTSTQVRVVLTVDGQEVYNVITDEESFRSEDVYLGFFGYGGGAAKLGNVVEINKVAVNTLFADVAGWKTGTSGANAPGFEIKDGALKLTSKASSDGWCWYTGQKFKNTVFSFKWSQNDLRYGRAGFAYLFLEEPSATSKPSDNTVDYMSYRFRNDPNGTNSNNNTIELYQAVDGAFVGGKQLEKYIYTNGFVANQEYDVTFGIYDISDTETKMVLTLDGVEIFSKVTTTEEFLSAEGYFGIYVPAQYVQAILK